MTQYDLDLLKIDLSIEQKCRTIGNLSDVALSTLFSWVRLY